VPRIRDDCPAARIRMGVSFISGVLPKKKGAVCPPLVPYGANSLPEDIFARVNGH
jgi:hypothetical protein